MLPSFVAEPDGKLRELTTICVDSSEFVVSKLKDRGTRQAFVFAQRYPARVRTLTLGGVVAPGFHLPLPYAHDFERSLVRTGRAAIELSLNAEKGSAAGIVNSDTFESATTSAAHGCKIGLV